MDFVGKGYDSDVMAFFDVGKKQKTDTCRLTRRMMIVKNKAKGD